MCCFSDKDGGNYRVHCGCPNATSSGALSTVLPAGRSCCRSSSTPASDLLTHGYAAPKPRLRWAGTGPGCKGKPPIATTFEEAARAWHANRLASLDAGHASRILTRLEWDAVLPLARSTFVLSPAPMCSRWFVQVEARGALDVSRRLKQHVSRIYRFAIPQSWADKDPAEHLSDLLRPRLGPSIWPGLVWTSCRSSFGRLTSMMVTRRPSEARSPALRYCSRC
jgi:hypothetical protein